MTLGGKQAIFVLLDSLTTGRPIVLVFTPRAGDTTVEQSIAGGSSEEVTDVNKARLKFAAVVALMIIIAFACMDASPEATFIVYAIIVRQSKKKKRTRGHRRPRRSFRILD